MARSPHRSAPSALAAALLVALAGVAHSGPPVEPARPGGGEPGATSGGKNLDEPNPLESARLFRRRQLLDQLQRPGASTPQVQALALEADALARTGSDRILVILVEFAGTDTFTWTRGASTWDPLGKTSTDEAVRDGNGNLVAGDCSLIITETRSFTYSGPLHNRIERPLSADDRSGTTIWTPDFATSYYNDLILGGGIVFDYARQDGSAVYRSFLGESVRDYYEDMSAGRYSLTGSVVGWVQVPHSIWWYGADQCPGARSAGSSAAVATNGAIPGAGTAKTLVVDALEAVKAAYPAFDWASYDRNKDGVIDRLWIIHAGYGEEEAPDLLDRTDYGEGQIWSHSSSVSPAYEIAPGVKAGPYIMMPENAGMGVLAHEFGHNLGAMDLYAYNGGDPSAGFWTVMCDDWTGYPIGFEPPAFDPWHLEGWGWLDPKVISDPTRTYTVKVGQASDFPGGADVYRGVKIILPDQQLPLAVAPHGSQEWWGGAENLLNSTMTLRSPIAVPAGGATLSLALAYRTESQWDWVWVQASADGGATWTTLTNAHTTCTHNPGWIGGLNGFPADLCGAGIGGFTGTSTGFPGWGTETFSLNAFAGRSVLLRFWYMTDWGTLDSGVFVDDVTVTSGAATLLSDNAEANSGLWGYAGAWARVAGIRSVPHAYYLQWRNVAGTGGYDASLGDPLFRYGPANTGLLVWYNDNRYSDNEVRAHLNDGPSFGAKGRVMLVDAHPEPYRWSGWIDAGWNNEVANAVHRQQMRDAPFSIHATTDFTLFGGDFPGRPGVAVFDDSLGYYPGAEWVSRGPGYSPPAWVWMTKQWDASAVVPSRTAYGIKAPGMLATDPLRFQCTDAADGKTTCNWFSSGIGMPGGTGNPGDAGGAYGWKVEVLSESDTQATLRISNSRTDCALTCAAAAPEYARVGESAQFTLTDQLTGCAGALTRAWDFGDGTTGAATAGASHTYARTGSYRWTASVTGAGRACTRNGYVTVGNGPDAAVTVDAVAVGDGQAAAVSFGGVARGGAGAVKVFTVSNGGDIPLTLGQVTVPAGYTVTRQPPAQVAARGEETFEVRLDADVPGLKNGKLSFATSQTGRNPFDFPVTGSVSMQAWRFDFGTATSPVAAGYTGVAPSLRYSAARGWGWASGTVDARDRATGDDLKRDFHFTAMGTFAVDVPRGHYTVTVTMGDASGAHDQMAVSIEGVRVDTVSTATNRFTTRTYLVTVGDGQLTLDLEDLGGTDAYAVINALVIAPGPPAKRLDPHGT